jgi:hypothetical protein
MYKGGGEYVSLMIRKRWALALDGYKMKPGSKYIEASNSR